MNGITSGIICILALAPLRSDPALLRTHVDHQWISGPSSYGQIDLLLTNGAYLSTDLIALMQVYMSPEAIFRGSDAPHWLKGPQDAE